MKDIHTIDTDVLIIGAAIAGIRAAIAAHDQGAKVTLVNKGCFGRDGASTWMAGHGYSVALYPPDSLDTHIKDAIRAGKYLNNQELVSTFLGATPQGGKELSRWGTGFLKDDKGSFKQIMLPGHTYPRSLITPMSALYPGPQSSRSLTSQVRQRKIDVVEDLFITDLLTRDGSVVGAVGIDLTNGEITAFQAKCTMLATGGFSNCYRLSTNGTSATGDGQAMAFRAGARLMDMEFQQFMPAAGLWPPSIQGSLTPYGMLVVLYGHYLNDQGERFMERYYPATKDWATRQETARAIANEVRVGMGSTHGGAFLTFKHQPRNLINRYLESNQEDPVVRKLRTSGIDLHQDAFEVGPHAHYAQGGCRINKKCETSLDGLYAVGEVASGLDGADRLAGNALPFCMAMGIIGGKEAAIKASTSQLPGFDEGLLGELRDQAYVSLERKGGIRPSSVKKKIHDILGRYASFYREEEGLKKGLEEITSVRENDIPELSISNKSRTFNLEWVEALEVRNMTDVAEMILRSAFMRTETRGAHERSDYPEEDPQWCKNIILQKVEDKVELSTEPVVFSYIKPEEVKQHENR